MATSAASASFTSTCVKACPTKLTTRFQAGSFDSVRGFAAFSPNLKDAAAVVAYEGSYSNGPFVNPLGYRRDNLTANYLRRFSPRQSFSLKMNGGLNNFTSSGQLPLDEHAVDALHARATRDRAEHRRLLLTADDATQDGIGVDRRNGVRLRLGRDNCPAGVASDVEEHVRPGNVGE